MEENLYILNKERCCECPCASLPSILSSSYSSSSSSISEACQLLTEGGFTSIVVFCGPKQHPQEGLTLLDQDDRTWETTPTTDPHIHGWGACGFCLLHALFFFHLLLANSAQGKRNNPPSLAQNFFQGRGYASRSQDMGMPTTIKIIIST